MYNLYTRRIKEKSHLKREEINFLITKSKLHQTDKAKILQRNPTRNTLALQKPKPSKCKRESKEDEEK